MSDNTDCQSETCAERSHSGRPHVQCHVITKKNKPCPHHANRLDGDKPVCHVHDPNGKARQNIRVKKVRREGVVTIRLDGESVSFPTDLDLTTIARIIKAESAG